MKRQLLLVALCAQVGCLSAQGSNAAPAAYNTILANSPFGQRTSETVASSTSVVSLELRGVIVDNGEVLFSVFDPATRASRWVGLNESGNSFTVRSYDSAKSEVKVIYQGRELVLRLKQATIIALAAPSAPATGPVPPPGNLPGNGSVPQPAANPGVNNDEAVRLVQIAEEIGRRRALRQQAKPRANPAPPSPPPPTK